MIKYKSEHKIFKFYNYNGGKIMEVNTKMQLHVLTEKRAREIAKQILEGRGKKNIRIGKISPKQFEGKKIYEAEVSYEED